MKLKPYTWNWEHINKMPYYDCKVTTALEVITYVYISYIDSISSDRSGYSHESNYSPRGRIADTTLLEQCASVTAKAMEK